MKQNPKIVILELGANDGLRGLSLEEMESNLEQIIGVCKEGGAKVLLAGMKIPPNYGEEYTVGFEQFTLDWQKGTSCRWYLFFWKVSLGNENTLGLMASIL